MKKSERKSEMSPARMAELYLGGMSLRKVGEVAGVSAATVLSALKTIGVQRRQPGLPKGIRRPWFVLTPEQEERRKNSVREWRRSPEGLAASKLGSQRARCKDSNAKRAEAMRTGRHGIQCAWCGDAIEYLALSKINHNDITCCCHSHATKLQLRPDLSHYWRSQVRPEFWRMQRDLGLTDSETFEAAGIDLPSRNVRCVWCGDQFDTFKARVVYCSQECITHAKNARRRAAYARKQEVAKE